MKKLSFLTVNYATKSLLEKFITNLLTAYENCEIIFIDNNSPDGSATLVEQLFGTNPKVTLIKTQNNGISAGYNLALHKATGEYLFYLGTDAFPTKEAIGKIVEYMDQHPEVGLVTPRLYTRDGNTDLDAHRGFPTPWVSLTHLAKLDSIFPKSKLFNGYSMLYHDLATIHEVDACISHFMCVRPEVHNKIGDWDTSYWMYGEDIDFCYRVKQVGYKIVYLGTVPVLHYKGAAVGRETSKDIENAMNTNFAGSDAATLRLKVKQESVNAMKTFYTKHYKAKYPRPLTMLVMLGIWLSEKIKMAKVKLKKRI